MQKANTLFLLCFVAFSVVLLAYGSQNSLGQFSIPGIIFFVVVGVVCYDLWKYRSESDVQQNIRDWQWNRKWEDTSLICIFLILYLSTCLFFVAVINETGIDFAHAVFHLSIFAKITIFLCLALVVISAYYAFRLRQNHAHNITLSISSTSTSTFSPESIIRLASGQTFQLVPDDSSSYDAISTTEDLFRERAAAVNSLPSDLRSVLNIK